MGAFAGPDISESGLVLALDAGNPKSLNIPTQADHGYADWYCLVSGTVTYSIVNPTGGVIYERNGSTITAVVTASTPQRGTFSITAGRFYYGSVPVNLVAEDQHHYIIPLTMMGTQFWNVVVRNNPSTYYVYSPYQSATVNFYDNTAGGLTGTPTSTLSLSAGQSGTFTSNNLTDHWISSNAPIIASTTQNGADKTILSPMSTYVYQRYQNRINTTNNTTPTNNNAYVTYDSTYKVMNMSIADGAGGDCAQGLGLEYLSDTYSWGNVLSDYTIVFPYTATVTTSYWSGSAWVVWDTHSNISGSITNPPRVMRDGTNGPGVEAGTISGTAANMASGATLWKWEGTAPFYLAINDNADDELSVFGWLSSRNTTPRSSNVITNITGSGNNGTLTNNPTYINSNGGILNFSHTELQHITFLNTSSLQFLNRSPYTLEAWVYPTRNPGASNWTGIFDRESNAGSGRDGYNIYFLGSSTTNTSFTAERFVAGSSFSVSITLNQSISVNNWSYIVSTYDGTTLSLYRNGSLVGTPTTTTGNITNTSKALTIGVRGGNYFAGNISNAKIYNRALTASEIQQNFNAIRSRFGI